MQIFLQFIYKYREGVKHKHNYTFTDAHNFRLDYKQTVITFSFSKIEYGRDWQTTVCSPYPVCYYK